jgi:hypothetical protein
MEKLTIYATGNERIIGDHNVSYYIIEKDKVFLDWLGDLLEQVLGMNGGKLKAKNYIKRLDNEEEQIIPKNIKKMKDVHERYDDKENRVDVFYGDKRVYLTFRKSRELREKFAKFVQTHADWVKIEQVSMEKLGSFQVRN